MSQSSAIEWTDATWNPTTGCDRVSPGCAHCYALDLAARLKAMGQPRYQRDGDPKTSGPGFGLTLHPDKLDEPLRWRKPRMVFVNSMSDLFHEEIPDWFLHNVFKTMHDAPQHTFQILTKRPERMLDWYREERSHFIGGTARFDEDWPLPNVWLGVSIENARFTWRADVLREIPAAVRFISAEPLLGSLMPERCGVVNFPADVIGGSYVCGLAKGHGGKHSSRYDTGDPGLGPKTRVGCEWDDKVGIRGKVREPFAPAPLDLTGIDWLIVGGESGPNFRPLNVDHARELRDACLYGSIDWGSGFGGATRRDVRTIGGERPSFFFKQVGGRTPKSGGRELDGRTWNEMPTHALVAA